MSLPTYIRRRVRKSEEYLAQQFGIPADQAAKMISAYRFWEKNDFEGYYVNPVKRHVRPFWLVPKRIDEQIVTLAAAGAAGDRARGIDFEIDTQGHFEIAYAMFLSTSPNFVVEIFDEGNNHKGFQNAEIHARTIGGTARRPFVWPETMFLNVENARRHITMNFRNLSAAPNAIKWCFHGRRWYHKEADAEVQNAISEKFQRMEKTFTTFLTLQPMPLGSPEGANPPAVTLAAGQTLQENQAPRFRSTDECDTEVHKLTYYATGPFEFQLREKQTGRILSNGWIQVTQGWGDGEFPFIVPETFLIERNLDVLFEVHDLSGVENRIFVTLTGRRLQYA